MGVGGKGGIFLQSAVEFLLQSRGLREQRARDLIGDVRFHIFLVFEASVEETPGGERVRRPRLEQMHQQPCAGLRDRYEQRAGGDVLELALPGTFELYPRAAFEGGGAELGPR